MLVKSLNDIPKLKALSMLLLEQANRPEKAIPELIESIKLPVLDLLDDMKGGSPNIDQCIRISWDLTDDFIQSVLTSLTTESQNDTMRVASAITAGACLGIFHGALILCASLNMNEFISPQKHHESVFERNEKGSMILHMASCMIQLQASRDLRASGYNGSTINLGKQHSIAFSPDFQAYRMAGAKNLHAIGFALAYGYALDFVGELWW